MHWPASRHGSERPVSAEPNLPPAIVLGIDTPIGLTVVRELGERGVAVHGIARGPSGVGLHSRWLHRGYVQPRGDEADIALLGRIVRDSGAEFVLTVSTRDAITVRRAADAGALGALRPLVAPMQQLAIVNDKATTYAFARKLGIATPFAWEPTAASWKDALPEALTFPCVLKWRDPDRIAAALHWNGLALEKYRYAHSEAELRAELARYEPVGEFPLVQTYAPGGGLGQMFLMHRGEAVLRFQHRRLAEWPPEGGTSVVCESIGLEENPDLLTRSEALLREVGWTGPAMVEYRFDPATRRAVLMEINGRFWGSLPLAYHAGAHFAWGTYAALGLERPDLVPTTVRQGVRCRYAVPEAKRLMTILLRPGAIQDRSLRFCRVCEVGRYLAAYLRPRTHYYVFSARDPGPFLADAWSIARKLVRAAFRRR